MSDNRFALVSVTPFRFQVTYRDNVLLKSSASLTEQVKRYILDSISQGDLVDDHGRLPSEPELSRALGVSRTTVREALSVLARDGVIISRHGVGTFVNRHARNLRSNITEVVEFSDLIAEEGYEAQVRLADVAVGTAGSMAESLHLAITDDILTVRKVFLADETPVIFCHNAVPLRVVLPEYRDQLSERCCQEPIYRFLLEKCQQNVLYHISRFNSAVADQEVGQLLACPEGQPLLRIEEIGFNDKQQPVLYSVSYYRDDLVHLHAVRQLVRPFSWERTGGTQKEH